MKLMSHKDDIDSQYEGGATESADKNYDMTDASSLSRVFHRMGGLKKEHLKDFSQLKQNDLWEEDRGLLQTMVPSGFWHYLVDEGESPAASHVSGERRDDIPSPNTLKAIRPFLKQFYPGVDFKDLKDGDLCSLLCGFEYPFRELIKYVEGSAAVKGTKPLSAPAGFGVVDPIEGGMTDQIYIEKTVLGIYIRKMYLLFSGQLPEGLYVERNKNTYRQI